MADLFASEGTGSSGVGGCACRHERDEVDQHERCQDGQRKRKARDYASRTHAETVRDETPGDAARDKSDRDTDGEADDRKGGRLPGDRRSDLATFEAEGLQDGQLVPTPPD